MARVSGRAGETVDVRVAARRHRRGIQTFCKSQRWSSRVRTWALNKRRRGANLRPASLGCLCCLRPRVDFSGEVDGCSAFAGEEVRALVLSTGTACACAGCGERC